MKHETMSGGVLELPEPPAELEAFLGRLRAALDNEGVSVAAFTALAFGVENPLLDTTSVPGRAVVTAAAHQSPWYHLIADLLVRKQAQQDIGRFTMTVDEAATKLGYTPGAVRQAVAAGRIQARRVDSGGPRGTLMLDPATVAALDTSKRRGPTRATATETAAAPHGPATGKLGLRAGELERKDVDLDRGVVLVPTAPATPELQAKIGSKAGVSFRIKGGGIVGGRMGAAHREGPIPTWERIAVLASKKSPSGARCWVIEPLPAGEENAIEFEGFYLRGKFRVVEKLNAESAARKRFETFTN